jgi:ribosomal protein S18 acetylase RimI-like enzyme
MDDAEMSSVRVVRYTPGRALDFERLNIEWLERWFTVEDVDRAVLGDPERHILAAGGQIFFADDESGTALGTVALRHEGGGVYELTKMAVAPAARGQGVGRLLGEAAIAEFRARKGRHLYLETNDLLQPAIALYKSLSFEDRPLRAGSLYSRANVHMVWVDEG